MINGGRDLSLCGCCRRSEADAFEVQTVPMIRGLPAPGTSVYEQPMELGYAFVGTGAREPNAPPSRPLVPKWWILIAIASAAAGAMLGPYLRQRFGLSLHLPGRAAVERRAAPAPNASVGTVDESHNCSAGYGDWTRSWPPEKRAYCCFFYRRGCPEASALTTFPPEPLTTSPEPPTASSEPYDCLAGFFNWGSQWSMEKQDWCCLHHQRGCATLPPSRQPASSAAPVFAMRPPAGCAALCSFGGQHFPCESRMHFAALHEFSGQPDACKMAWDRVRSQCLWCASCQLDGGFCLALAAAAASTSPPLPLPAPAPVAALAVVVVPGGPPARQDSLRQAVATSTAAATSARTPHLLAPFDCTGSYGSWETSWSVRKKRWCCQHERRGCPDIASVPYNCQDGFAGGERGWSVRKQAWCCKAEHRGCPPLSTASSSAASSAAPYDCGAGAANWRSGWSEVKKGWCCAHASLGCG